MIWTHHLSFLSKLARWRQMLVETRYLRKGSSAETLSAVSLQKLIEVIIILSCFGQLFRASIKCSNPLCRVERKNLNFLSAKSGWWETYSRHDIELSGLVHSAVMAHDLLLACDQFFIALMTWFSPILRSCENSSALSTLLQSKQNPTCWELSAQSQCTHRFSFPLVVLRTAYSETVDGPAA